MTKQQILEKIYSVDISRISKGGFSAERLAGTLHGFLHSENDTYWGDFSWFESFVICSKLFGFKLRLEDAECSVMSFRIVKTKKHGIV